MLYRNSKTISHIVKNKKKGHLPVATILFAAVASLLCAPHTVRAECKTYYVSTSGSDSNPGTSALPWATLKIATWKMVACDKVYVHGGVYKSTNLWFTNNGTASQPISILAYPGEKPILDASGITIDGWMPSFGLTGNYIQLSGFEVRNGGVGVYVTGNHNTVSNMNVHHVLQNGILARGDYSIVENSNVSWACMDHYNYLIGKGGSNGWPSGLSAARDSVDGITQHAILRGNIVFNNWCEGLSTYEADGTIIENNIVYDNWALNAYISDARNVIFRNNLVYNTPNSINDVIGTRAPSRPASALTLADEVSSKPRSTNNIVVNNMFLNGDISAFAWTVVSGSRLVNALIANNTFVNSIFITGSINQGSTIQNNIFFTTKGTQLASIPTRSGLKLSNNLWLIYPSLNARGIGDVLGNPKLALVGVVQPGQLTKGYFAVSSSSPAIGKGAALYGITDDYLVTSKSAVLNMGAYLADPPIQYLTGTLK